MMPIRGCRHRTIYRHHIDKTDMANEITMSLRIMEFPFDPSRITEEVGMEPTRTWLQGEKITPRTSC